MDIEVQFFIKKIYPPPPLTLSSQGTRLCRHELGLELLHLLFQRRRLCADQRMSVFQQPEGVPVNPLKRWRVREDINGSIAHVNPCCAGLVNGCGEFVLFRLAAAPATLEPEGRVLLLRWRPYPVKAVGGDRRDSAAEAHGGAPQEVVTLVGTPHGRHTGLVHNGVAVALGPVRVYSRPAPLRRV